MSKPRASESPGNVRVLAHEAAALCCRALERAGTPTDLAGQVADHLVDADLAGVASHGIAQLPRYVAAISDGFLRPAARPVVERHNTAAVLVSGEGGFGQVATRVATAEAVSIARSHGVGVAAVRDAHHAGRLGAYAEQAAAAGALLLLWSGGQGEGHPSAVPHGGRRPLFQTNPVAFGFPGPESGPIVADFATTVMAGARIQRAADRGESLPPGAIVDRHGNATTDPLEFLERGGAHLPFGGHKGFALMLACEIFGRIVSAADADRRDPIRDPLFRQAGTLAIALSGDLFRSRDEHEERMEELAQRVRGCPPRPGTDRVRLPGDPEREARKGHGGVLSVPVDLWSEVERLAADGDVG